MSGWDTGFNDGCGLEKKARHQNKLNEIRVGFWKVVLVAIFSMFLLGK